MFGLTNFVRPNILKPKNLASIYGQDMELLMQEFHMYLLDIKSSPKLTGQHDNRVMSFIRLNLLTKTSWKLKTPGGILVFRLLVQVWFYMAGLRNFHKSQELGF